MDDQDDRMKIVMSATLNTMHLMIYKRRGVFDF